VQERLRPCYNSSNAYTYCHVAPGLQQAAAEGFDKKVLENREKEPLNKMVSHPLTAWYFVH
jgi:hypothetical protein